MHSCRSYFFFIPRIFGSRYFLPCHQINSSDTPIPSSLHLFVLGRGLVSTRLGKGEGWSSRMYVEHYVLLVSIATYRSRDGELVLYPRCLVRASGGAAWCVCGRLLWKQYLLFAAVVGTVIFSFFSFPPLTLISSTYPPSS